jgi:hypothetical protein
MFVLQSVDVAHRYTEKYKTPPTYGQQLSVEPRLFQVRDHGRRGVAAWAVGATRLPHGPLRGACLAEIEWTNAMLYVM